jgi:hypothetical protein
MGSGARPPAGTFPEGEAVLGDRARRWVPGLAAVALAAGCFLIASHGRAAASPDEIAQYRFTPMPIAFPAGYDAQPMRAVRTVNPAYQKLRSWISSVGAGVALNDLTGHGRSDALCIVDTRTDDVVVTYAPTARPADRFTPFVLDAGPLPMDDTMAPMGCTPGDFNGDGRMDLLVTYWGRVPILFLARAGATTLSNAAYRPQELLPQASPDGRYHGPRWNTNAVAVADFDGDGHPDVYVGNYFPDSDVLDPHGLDNVQMNGSMSSARNGGGNRVLRWYSATTGAEPTARYVEDAAAVPYAAATGWTLAVSSADLTGSGRPDVYVANDFGPDHLLHNVSTPGRIRFTVATGSRTPTTPKSFALGHDSFKGMGVDFGDIDRSGRFDMVVSNITTAWGLQESNFLWRNTAADGAAAGADLDRGVAPFEQQAREFGLAWTGWGWDVKFGDFRNSGDLDVVQADGFVKGSIDRWPWLQEVAMSNDNLLSDPSMWLHVRPGDDIAGNQALAFYARGTEGTYRNISDTLGLAVHTPTRGVATADTTGDGALDLAVARQWGPPAFYRNDTPDRGNYLDLRLLRPATGETGGLRAAGTPAYGATARVSTADGRTQLLQLDGGSGHSGKRSFEIHAGLGRDPGPVRVDLQWRDNGGAMHRSTQRLAAGSHTLLLDSSAQEVAG